VDFAGDDVDLGALSSLRLFRILRVLKAVTRFKVEKKDLKRQRCFKNLR
jgi:hypothetical protein